MDAPENKMKTFHLFLVCKCFFLFFLFSFFGLENIDSPILSAMQRYLFVNTWSMKVWVLLQFLKHSMLKNWI